MDVDFVLDLYCDNQVVMYFYIGMVQVVVIVLLVGYFGVQVLLFVEVFGDEFFDEFVLWIWWEFVVYFKGCFFIDFFVCLVVIVELCGEIEVVYEFVVLDVDVLIVFLQQ